MKYINVSNRKPINIGRRGEESVTTVRFSINAFFPHMPSSATYGLIHQRHNDAAPYPCTIAVADGYINWVIGSGDLANVGNGTAQLSAYLDGAVAKTVIFTTVTTDSMGATNPPDPQQIWIDEVINAGNRAEQAAIEAEEIRDSIEPEIVWVTYRLPTSAELDALYQAGKLVAFKSSITGCIYFLTKRVSATSHEFTATNETVLRCVRVVDDVWYDTDVYNFATEGYVTSYVGSKASNNTPADLAVTPYAGSSLDFSRADHVHKLPSAADIGAYVKPSGGVPKTDLASAVQTSLGKADSAYQKPSGGIPKADLASAVQVSLGKADSALQTAPVTSVNGETGDVELDIPNIDPDAKTSDMTQSVGVDSSGKLWTAPGGGGGSVTVDDALSDSSTNPVQNKVVKAAVDAKYTKPSTGIPASDLAAGVIPDAEVFWATYGTTTTAEIFAAYNAHKIIICKFNGRFYQLVRVTGQSQFEFSYAYEDYIHNLVAYGTNSWTDNSYQLATQGAVDAKYTKPSGGIPASDLASAVQTSLGKADNAIAAPSSPATGAFLVWSGSAWTAQTLATWQASSY